MLYVVSKDSGETVFLGDKNIYDFLMFCLPLISKERV